MVWVESSDFSLDRASVWVEVLDTHRALLHSESNASARGIQSAQPSARRGHMTKRPSVSSFDKQAEAVSSGKQQEGKPRPHAESLVAPSATATTEYQPTVAGSMSFQSKV
mmetsp:Transcript_10664/g.20676  ORF Transcript_10664/g.20676 Transcript_10664/m.20676 type:complete len:110 (+) Transcript_10664:3-332(+)